MDSLHRAAWVATAALDGDVHPPDFLGLPAYRQVYTAFPISAYAVASHGYRIWSKYDYYGVA